MLDSWEGVNRVQCIGRFALDISSHSSWDCLEEHVHYDSLLCYSCAKSFVSCVSTWIEQWYNSRVPSLRYWKSPCFRRHWRRAPSLQTSVQLFFSFAHEFTCNTDIVVWYWVAEGRSIKCGAAAAAPFCAICHIVADARSWEFELLSLLFASVKHWCIMHHTRTKKYSYQLTSCPTVSTAPTLPYHSFSVTIQVFQCVHSWSCLEEQSKYRLNSYELPPTYVAFFLVASCLLSYCWRF